MVRHPFFQNSLCLNSYLHRFEIREEYPEGVLEICEVCKMRKFFKLMDGRPDNDGYMSWHFRNILPQSHPYYPHEYPEAEGILSPIQI